MIYHGALKTIDDHACLEMSVKKGDKELFKKLYQSPRSMTTSMLKITLGIEQRINKMLKRGFRDIFSQFVKDLNEELAADKEKSL
jgi:hypothetical protein